MITATKSGVTSGMMGGGMTLQPPIVEKEPEPKEESGGCTIVKTGSTSSCFSLSRNTGECFTLNSSTEEEYEYNPEVPVVDPNRDNSGDTLLAIHVADDYTVYIVCQYAEGGIYLLSCIASFVIGEGITRILVGLEVEYGTLLEGVPSGGSWTLTGYDCTSGGSLLLLRRNGGTPYATYAIDMLRGVIGSHPDRFVWVGKDKFIKDYDFLDDCEKLYVGAFKNYKSCATDIGGLPPESAWSSVYPPDTHFETFHDQNGFSEDVVATTVHGQITIKSNGVTYKPGGFKYIDNSKKANKTYNEHLTVEECGAFPTGTVRSDYRENGFNPPVEQVYPGDSFTHFRYIKDGLMVFRRSVYETGFTIPQVATFDPGDIREYILAPMTDAMSDRHAYLAIRCWSVTDVGDFTKTPEGLSDGGSFTSNDNYIMGIAHVSNKVLLSGVNSGVWYDYDTGGYGRLTDYSLYNNFLLISHQHGLLITQKHLSEIMN